MSKYDIIVADPCWDYSEKTFLNSGSMHNGVRVTSHVTNHYKTLKMSELIDMRYMLDAWSADNCLLFMWFTGPFFAKAPQLGEAWGFTPVTISQVWHKKNPDNGKEQCNPGNYTMSSCEFVGVFKKGRIPGGKKADEIRRGIRNSRQFFEAPRKKHSEKPPYVNEQIELMFPKHKKLEMFARTSYPGWDCWGNEAPNGIPTPERPVMVLPRKRKA